MSKKPSSESQLFHFDFRYSHEHDECTQESLYHWLAGEDNIDKFIFQAELTTRDGKRNPHYQGYFHCKQKKRAKHLAISLNDRFSGIHIGASSTAGKESLKNYAMKDRTRVAGPWADRKIYLGKDLWPEYKLPAWQKTMLSIFSLPPGDRIMHWIYDPIGNNGKTKFVKYLVYKKDAVGLGYGSSTDVLNLAYKFQNRSIYAWNLTRAKPATFSELDFYSAIESVKDGFFINLKFETAQVLMDPPHVMIVANHVPKYHHISADRWKIWEIVDSELKPYTRITADERV